MKKTLLLLSILFIAVISTACINNFAVQELNNKAKAYLDNGDYLSAINRLESSIDLDNTIFETHYNLAVAYTMAENFEKAVLSYQNAAALKPDYPETYYSLAVAQVNHAEAILSGKYLAKTAESVENVKIDLNNSTASGLDNSFKPSAEDKAKAVSEFSNAVNSYSKYLSFEVKDADDVNAQIERVKSRIDSLTNTKK